jgi:hypothetical protein
VKWLNKIMKESVGQVVSMSGSFFPWSSIKIICGSNFLVICAQISVYLLNLTVTSLPLTRTVSHNQDLYEVSLSK